MEHEKETTKWRSKDSVFVNLFEDVKNVLALYKHCTPRIRTSRQRTSTSRRSNLCW